MVRSRPRILAATAGLALLAAASVRGQAWLPPKGEAWLSFGYGNIHHEHSPTAAPGASSAGTSRPIAGHIRTQTLGLVVGYGFTDRLAFKFRFRSGGQWYSTTADSTAYASASS